MVCVEPGGETVGKKTSQSKPVNSTQLRSYLDTARSSFSPTISMKDATKYAGPVAEQKRLLSIIQALNPGVSIKKLTPEQLRWAKKINEWYPDIPPQDLVKMNLPPQKEKA